LLRSSSNPFLYGGFVQSLEEENGSNLTPKKVVEQLNRYIVGQVISLSLSLSLSRYLTLTLNFLEYVQCIRFFSRMFRQVHPVSFLAYLRPGHPLAFTSSEVQLYSAPHF
jgi:hypothetical protein